MKILRDLHCACGRTWFVEGGGGGWASADAVKEQLRLCTPKVSILISSSSSATINTEKERII